VGKNSGNLTVGVPVKELSSSCEELFISENRTGV
jgi:hypothetical protein